MQVLTGRALQEQIVIGRLHFYRREPEVLEPLSHRTAEQEELRYFKTRQRVILELASLYDRAAVEVGEEIATIFAIHAMMLEDEDMERQTLSKIWKDGTTAEYAVQTVGASFAHSFAQMESTYMQARAVDIQDITHRMVLRLLQKRPSGQLKKEASIVVAESFLPSEVMELNQRKLLGLISTKGNINSHAALLLRAYQIPTMAEIDLDPLWENRLALMNGFTHQLYLDPSQELMEQLRQSHEQDGNPLLQGV